MGVIGEAFVRVRPDVGNFGSEVERGVGAPLGKVSSLVKGAVGAFVAFKGAQIVTDTIRSSVDAASDLNESVTKTQRVFGTAAGTVLDFGKTAADAIGQSNQQAIEAASTYGNLFRSMGVGQKQSAGLSVHLVKLAGDLASFNNVSPAETLDALRSGLVGEVEPLRRFGVSLSQQAIQAKAVSSGIVKLSVDSDKLTQASLRVGKAQDAVTTAIQKHGKGSKEAVAAQAGLTLATHKFTEESKGHLPVLTAQQKSLAAYKLIMEQTKLAQGDFGRTSDGLANQQRILSANVTDLKAKFGGLLLPVFTAITGALIYLTKTVPPLVQEFMRLPQVRAVIAGVSEVIDEARSHVDDVRAAFATARSVGTAAFNAIAGPVQALADHGSSLVETLGGIQNTLIAIGVAVATYIALTAGIAIASAAYTALSAAIFLARNAQLALDVAMEANPIGLIVVAIAALVAGLYLAYTRIDGFRNIVNSAFAFVKEFIPQAMDAARTAIATTVAIATGLWNTFGGTITAVAQTAFGTVRTIIEGVLQVIRGVINIIVGLATGDWQRAWDGFKQVVSGLITVVTAELLALPRLLVTLATNLGPLAIAAGKVIVTKIVEGLRELASAGASALLALPAAILAMHVKAGQLAIAAGKFIVTQAISGLSALAGLALAKGTEAATAIATGIKSAPAKLAGLGGDLASAVGAGVGEAARGAFNLARRIGTNIVEGVLDGVKDLPGRLGSALASAGSSAVGWATSHFGSTAFEHSRDVLGMPIGAGTVAGAGIGMAPLKDILATGARRALDGLALTITDASKKPTDATKAMVDRIGKQVQGIATTINSEQARIKSAFDGLSAGAFQAFDARTQQLLDKNTAKWTTWGDNLKRIAATSTANLQSTMSAGLAQLESEQSAAIARLDAQLQTQLAAIGATQKVLTPAEAILKQTQDAHDQAGRNAAIATAQAAVEAAQQVGDAQALADALKQLDDANYTQHIVDLQTQAAAERAVVDANAAAAQAAAQTYHDTQVAAEKAAYDQRMADTKAFYDGQIAEIAAKLDQQLAEADAKAKKEQLNINAQQTYKKGVLTDELANLQTQLAKHPEMYEKIHAKILKLFRDDFGPNYRTAGQNLGDAFAKGMRDSFDGVRVAASELAGEVAKYLKVKSPTDLGPMSNLDSWWKALPDTLVKGVDKSALGGIVDGIAQPGFAGAAGGGGGRGWDEDAFIEKLARALGREIPATSIAWQQAADELGMSADDQARAAIR